MEAYRRPRTEAFERPRANLFERAGFGRLDPLLLFGGVALIAFSIYTLGVATSEDVPGNPYFYVVRQSIYAVVGIALMFAVSRIDYSRFRELRVGIYTAMIASILLVFLFAEATRGSHRWIELPFFTFQPSELGKVLLVVTLAAFVLDRARHGTEIRRTVRLLSLGLFPAALVFLQPDLGTALVYGVITLSVLFIAGIPWSHFAALVGGVAATILVVLVIAPAAGFPILAEYQQDRLTAFLHPSDDPADSSYQINQALIAVGSGGKTGRGDDATQTQNGFLPERHTDFIFAVVGERFGFVGAAFLLSLYALLIWRALRIMTLSKNLYGSMIAGGIAAMLMFQVFVNVGMNLGIMPITGIPLPLMSSGGSSVIVTFLALGLLQSIYVQAQLTSKRGSTPF
ncbi:MAG: rod shape-determining protein RodA [Solirubrobacterales bacterium]